MSYSRQLCCSVAHCPFAAITALKAVIAAKGQCKVLNLGGEYLSLKQYLDFKFFKNNSEDN